MPPIQGNTVVLLVHFGQGRPISKLGRLRACASPLLLFGLIDLHQFPEDYATHWPRSVAVEGDELDARALRVLLQLLENPVAEPRHSEGCTMVMAEFPPSRPRIHGRDEVAFEREFELLQRYECHVVTTEGSELPLEPFISVAFVLALAGDEELEQAATLDAGPVDLPIDPKHRALYRDLLVPGPMVESATPTSVRIRRRVEPLGVELKPHREAPPSGPREPPVERDVWQFADHTFEAEWRLPQYVSSSLLHPLLTESLGPQYRGLEEGPSLQEDPFLHICQWPLEGTVRALAIGLGRLQGALDVPEASSLVLETACASQQQGAYVADTLLRRREEALSICFRLTLRARGPGGEREWALRPYVSVPFVCGLLRRDEIVDALWSGDATLPVSLDVSEAALRVLALLVVGDAPAEDPASEWSVELTCRY